MPEIDLPLRIAILKEAINYAKKVGAYQAYDWLESHVHYLRSTDNATDKTGSRDDAEADRGS